MIKKLLCNFGIHEPLEIDESIILFTDKVEGKAVYRGICHCKKEWMVTKSRGLGLFKVSYRQRLPENDET